MSHPINRIPKNSHVGAREGSMQYINFLLVGPQEISRSSLNSGEKISQFKLNQFEEIVKTKL